MWAAAITEGYWLQVSGWPEERNPADRGEQTIIQLSNQSSNQ
jgi:hypothetical protein